MKKSNFYCGKRLEFHHKYTANYLENQFLGYIVHPVDPR